MAQKGVDKNYSLSINYCINKINKGFFSSVPKSYFIINRTCCVYVTFYSHHVKFLSTDNSSKLNHKLRLFTRLM